MTDATFTYTARSTSNPDKVATFTLQNGTASVELGSAIIKQMEDSFVAVQCDQAHKLAAWLEPAATSALQRIAQPVPHSDFEASVEGSGLRALAWIRAGGLRLAPVVGIWQEVDNVPGARAFVEEVEQRKKASIEKERMPDPFDYWAGWALVGLLTLTVPIVLMRLLSKRRAESD
jgi:hypothetical protein